MPRISDRSKPATTAHGRLGLAGLPDRDNPFAWKQKTREGTRGARDLLADLTDEEVARYMSVALDQVRLENAQPVLKIGVAIAGCAAVAAALWIGFSQRFSGWDIAGLGLGLAMVYWPWRVLLCRRLWQKHYDAAKAEQVRRSGAA
jgi:hypothetical protein